MSDVERITQEAQAQLKPARDSEFQLLCGAAISATRNKQGEIDRDRIINHVSALTERGVDAELFPILWRPRADRIAADWGLPVPGVLQLVENPAFPPRRVVIRRAGDVVFDAMLPETDGRHILDAAKLDSDDLKAFFEANRASFASAEAVTGSPDHYYVPDWSVPI